MLLLQFYIYKCYHLDGLNMVYNSIFLDFKKKKIFNLRAVAMFIFKCCHFDRPNIVYMVNMILPVNFNSTMYNIVLHSVSIQHARFRIKPYVCFGNQNPYLEYQVFVYFSSCYSILFKCLYLCILKT